MARRCFCGAGSEGGISGIGGPGPWAAPVKATRRHQMRGCGPGRGHAQWQCHITTHAAATRVCHPRALPAAPGMHASGRHQNASRGPWHPHCTCRKAPCMHTHAACASDGQRPVGRCYICGIYSISGGVIYLDCFNLGCFIPGRLISGPGRGWRHGNVLAHGH